MADGAGALGSCSTPADSPLTSFNETSMFNMSKGPRGCYDYIAWAEVTGKLSAKFPHLRYLNIDDLCVRIHLRSCFSRTALTPPGTKS